MSQVCPVAALVGYIVFEITSCAEILIQSQAVYDVPPQPQLSVQGTFTTICQLELV